MAHFTTVFLSSTAKDLQPYRDAVAEAIAKLAGFHCVRMEDFGAVDAEPLEACRRRVAESEVFVGLVGHLNGSSPEGSPLSFTQIEYEEAKKAGKPRLLFLADDDFPVPAKLMKQETEEAYERQLRFRDQVQRERTTVSFHEPQKLSTLVVAALQSLPKQAVDAVQTGDREALLARLGAGVAIAAGPSAREREVAWTRYLSWVIAETGFLTLAGIDPAVAEQPNRDSRLSLTAVYSGLRTSTSRERTEAMPGVGEDRGAPLSALEALDRHSRLVLLGDPGSGKSTFVSFVALCLAGERLGRQDANLKRLTAPLPGDKNSEAQPWSQGPLVPVRIVLREFAARGLPMEPEERGTAKHVWDFLQLVLEEAALADSLPFVREELGSGQGLVLFDGLDEVPEAEGRRDQIVQALESFSASLGPSRILVTSRPYAYQYQGWRLSGFAEAALAPFSPEQIEFFIEVWYGELLAQGRVAAGAAEGQAELLRRAIFTSDRLLGLAERPLLLTLMASLHHWRGGSLPERREELYAEAVELLLNTWENQRRVFVKGKPVLVQPSLAEWLKVDREKVGQVLEELAFEVHGAQVDPDPAGGAADLKVGRLIELLLRVSRNPGASAEKLLEYLRDRAGLLVERGDGVCRFPHRTFQEYLAACYLTRRSFPREVARLGRQDPGRWREVVLLAGARARRVESSVWALAEALCPPGGVAPPSEEDRWGALLAGQVLAESVDLTSVEPQDKPKLERVQEALRSLLRTESFPAKERAAAGNSLSVLGDPRFDASLWGLPNEEDLGFVEIPAGPFLMGSDRAVDPEAEDWEFHQQAVSLPRYWLSRYPVTVGQYRVFVEQTGFAPQDPDSLEGASNLPVVWVSWQEALEYCAWLGDRLLERARTIPQAGALWLEITSGSLRSSLPSEAEWEKGARGLNGQIYPWGNAFEPNRANCLETGVNERSAVGCFSFGASPYGCEDLSGNVLEWTRSNDLDDAEESVESLEAQRGLEQSRRALRGGAFYHDSRKIRCACRYWDAPDYRSGRIGFRVVLSPFRP